MPEAETAGRPRDWVMRRAGQDDVDLLAIVGAATFLETFADVHTGAEIVAHCRDEHSAAAYAQLFAKGADAWLVETRATGAPVGYAVLTPPDLPGMQPGDLELKRIYFLARLHGSGAAAALIRDVIARAKARGAKRLLLDVYSKNERAIAFYRKYGFEKIA
ncbi:MAG: GNAT family N-acetyltransferase, partial [Alphaproteobacteria bacterium]|nr:GNAT family N-acetyltransferase [Alphaproteobacteria bacterium]